MRPTNLKYTETHEWVRKGAKGDATVGITDHAVSQLSDLVHIELPKKGAKVEQGNPFGEIESVKTVADLVSPVTGEITVVNIELADSLDTLSKDPFEEGWLIKVKLENDSELGPLMSVKEYEEFLETAEKEEEAEDDDADDDDF